VSDIQESTRELIERTLDRLEMVEWDRFTVGNAPDLAGRYIKVYGWIDRDGSTVGLEHLEVVHPSVNWIAAGDAACSLSHD